MSTCRDSENVRVGVKDLVMGKSPLLNRLVGKAPQFSGSVLLKTLGKKPKCNDFIFSFFTFSVLV